MHSPARFHFPTFGHLLFLLSKTRRVLLLFTVLQVERLDAYEGLFAQAGQDRPGLEAVRLVGALRGAFMGPSVEKVRTLDFARFIDQTAQRFAGAVQAVGQQGRKSGLQGMVFATHGPALDAFEGVGKNASKKPPPG